MKTALTAEAKKAASPLKCERRWAFA